MAQVLVVVIVMVIVTATVLMVLGAIARDSGRGSGGYCCDHEVF